MERKVPRTDRARFCSGSLRSVRNYWYSFKRIPRPTAIPNRARTKSHKVESVTILINKLISLHPVKNARVHAGVSRQGYGRISWKSKKRNERGRVRCSPDTLKTVIEQNDSNRMQILDVRRGTLSKMILQNDRDDAADVGDNDVKKTARITRVRRLKNNSPTSSIKLIRL